MIGVVTKNGGIFVELELARNFSTQAQNHTSHLSFNENINVKVYQMDYFGYRLRHQDIAHDVYSLNNLHKSIC